VRWRNESRNERFALVAKSIEGKEDLREDGYLVFDLEDIGRLSREYLARMDEGSPAASPARPLRPGV
jgi:hypothetical protein